MADDSGLKGEPTSSPVHRTPVAAVRPDAVTEREPVSAAGSTSAVTPALIGSPQVTASASKEPPSVRSHHAPAGFLGLLDFRQVVGGHQGKQPFSFGSSVPGDAVWPVLYQVSED